MVFCRSWSRHRFNHDSHYGRNVFSRANTNDDLRRHQTPSTGYSPRRRRSFLRLIFWLVTLPVLSVLVFRPLFLLHPTPDYLILKQLSRQQISNGGNVTGLEAFNEDSRYQDYVLPAYARFAPRRSRFSIVSPRDPLESVTANSSSSYLPRIHAVFICDSPCCINTLYPAIRALVLQTLPPTHLTFVHSCSTSNRNEFRREARRALAGSINIATSYTLRPHVFFHVCTGEDIEPCALDYMAHLANLASPQYPHYTFILSERILLENTAVEKAWLSFTVRPHVNAIRMQSYDFNSLEKAERGADPLLIHPVWPEANYSLSETVVPVPMLYATAAYRTYTVDSYSMESPNVGWLPFIPLIRIASDARMIREPLYSFVHAGIKNYPIFSLARLGKSALPANLYSEYAYYRWSARQDEGEMYKSSTPDAMNMDLEPISFWPVRAKKSQHIMLVLPWMQMGGSEKCMLDVAAATIARGWGVTFVLTMPYWAEDPVGELYLHHEWYNRAVHLTTDVFDLLALGPDQKASRLFRYLLESRQPEFILTSNSRWAYAHASFIRALLPGAVVADYNHMIHKSWDGGGMPRYGANNSAYFDVHLTASHDVTNAMKKWIDVQLLRENSDYVHTCYIGTDASLLHTAEERPNVRETMRHKFGVSESAIVVLFAGRFVVDKGIDVASEVVKMVVKDEVLSKRLVFVFIGSGDQENLLTALSTQTADNSTFVVVQPPATGLEELRDFYAMSDIFLLLSVNEGIALVVYEAMADGLLVMTTDVGGQREIVHNDTGVLLPNYRTISGMANRAVEELKLVVSNPERFSLVRAAGQKLVRSKYTTESFTECVIDHLINAEPKAKERATRFLGDINSRVDHLRTKVALGVEVERWHGKWNRNLVYRPIENFVTVGVKTYVCDESIRNQVENLVRSIRVHHPRVRILLGNDGPTVLSQEAYVQNDPNTEEVRLPSDSGISYGRNVMVNLTTTKFFLLLDDDHIFDDTTSLMTVVNALRDDTFDYVGLRVRNLPGIDEYERLGILIPRYVALIQKFEGMDLTLCVWNENKGPSVYGITHPIPVDVLHNAFLGNTEILRKHPWRNELKVNEHMTFFLDAKDANLSIGYLPSVFVHHRARDYSDCYYKVRFREDKFQQLLRYKDQFLWDIECGKEFPNRVKRHILLKELDVL